MEAVVLRPLLGMAEVTSLLICNSPAKPVSIELPNGGKKEFNDASKPDKTVAPLENGAAAISTATDTLPAPFAAGQLQG